MDLNSLNQQLASFKTRNHLSLSFISGAQVRQWKERMRLWIRNPLVNDNEANWDQFIDLFKAQYADTQKGERARTNIENITMKNMDIDQYIADFIDLATEADYHRMQKEPRGCSTAGSLNSSEPRPPDDSPDSTPGTT
jgi:hypothetical protein